MENMQNMPVEEIGEEVLESVVELSTKTGTFKNVGIGVVAGMVGVIAYQKGIKPLVQKWKDKSNVKKAAKAKLIDDSDVEEYEDDYPEDENINE